MSAHHYFQEHAHVSERILCRHANETLLSDSSSLSLASRLFIQHVRSVTGMRFVMPTTLQWRFISASNSKITIESSPKIYCCGACSQILYVLHLHLNIGQAVSVCVISDWKVEQLLTLEPVCHSIILA